MTIWFFVGWAIVGAVAPGAVFFGGLWLMDRFFDDPVKRSH